MASVVDLVVGTGTMRNGRLFIAHRRAFDQQLRQLDERWTLEVLVQRLRATRSVAQNRYYWSGVLGTLSSHTGYTVDELHDLMKMRFLPKHLALTDGNGEVKGEFVIGGSSRKLSTGEFSDYIERIRQFAAEDLDCNIPDAEGAF